MGGILVLLILWINNNIVTVTYVTDYCKTAKYLIDNAKSDIRVALFLMRYTEKNQCPEILVRSLANAKARGVDVVVYLEEDNYNVPAERYLLENNVPVLHPKGFLHAKVLKADNCFIIGSHNWTWSAMHRNMEASILVCNSSVIEVFFSRLNSLTTR